MGDAAPHPSMSIDISHIPLDSIGPNSLLVIRTDMRADLEAVRRLMADLRPKLDPSVRVLVMDRDTEICHVDEALMNEAGWYRRPAAAPNE